MKKRILVLLLALVMVAGFALPAAAAQDELVSDEPVVITEDPAPASDEVDVPLTAVALSDGDAPAATTQESVQYVDIYGTTKTVNATVVTSTTTLNGGWYVVKNDATINSGVTVTDNVNLILCDGKTLTVNGGTDGIEINDGASLTIYAQSTGTSAGTLTASTESAGNGIHVVGGGSLTVNGGNVTATGGIGLMILGSATVNGGKLDAMGNTNEGIYVTSTTKVPSNLTVNGGTVIARSSANSAVFLYDYGSVTYGTLTLPSAYYWRTAADGKYRTQASYDASAPEKKYFEITATKPTSNIEPYVTGATATVTYGDAVNGSAIKATTTEVNGTFAWKDDVTGYGDASAAPKKLMATFTPSNSSYVAVDVEVSVTVEPKTIGIDWTDTKLTHNGKAQKPAATATGLVNGDECTITVTGEQTEAGTYTATVTGLDNPNYKLPENVTCEFTIVADKIIDDNTKKIDDNTATSPKTEKAPLTGDAGIAMYVLSAASSMIGLVWLGRKKKR